MRQHDRRTAKRKFGGLRFYTDHRATGDEDFIVFIIDTFEEMLDPNAQKGICNACIANV